MRTIGYLANDSAAILTLLRRMLRKIFEVTCWCWILLVIVDRQGVADHALVEFATYYGSAGRLFEVGLGLQLSGWFKSLMYGLPTVVLPVMGVLFIWFHENNNQMELTAPTKEMKVRIPGRRRATME